MKATLYELTADYQQVLVMIYSDEHEYDVIADTLEGIEGEIEVKAEGYVKVIKTLEADIEAIEKEEQRLRARKTRFKNNVDRLKQSLDMAMRVTGKPKLKAGLFTISIRKNGGLQPLKILENATIPETYLIYPEPVPNNELIREELNQGKVLEFAKLEERGEHLVIR